MGCSNIRSMYWHYTECHSAEKMPFWLKRKSHFQTPAFLTRNRKRQSPTVEALFCFAAFEIIETMIWTPMHETFGFVPPPFLVPSPPTHGWRCCLPEEMSTLSLWLVTFWLVNPTHPLEVMPLWLATPRMDVIPPAVNCDSSSEVPWPLWPNLFLLWVSLWETKSSFGEFCRMFSWVKVKPQRSNSSFSSFLLQKN